MDETVESLDNISALGIEEDCDLDIDDNNLGQSNSNSLAPQKMTSREENELYRTEIDSFQEVLNRTEALQSEALAMRKNVMDLADDFTRLKTTLRRTRKATNAISSDMEDLNREVEMLEYLEKMMGKLIKYGEELRLTPYPFEAETKKQKAKRSVSHLWWTRGQSTDEETGALKSITESDANMSKSDSFLL